MQTTSDNHAGLRSRLSGLLLPITTPFQSNGSVDFEGLRANIEKWNQTGISGYVLLGSTGERVHLDEGEQRKTISTAREAIPRDRLFIVGAGQQSTLTTINEIKRVATDVSVDAFLVITPHFYRPAITQQSLIEHYERVANKSPVPLILYSMPALTGVKIDAETAASLSGHQNIIGIKDSSNDIETLRQSVGLSSDNFVVLTGNGTIFSQALHAGAAGGILAVGCVATELCLAILHDAKSVGYDAASNLQDALTPLAEAVTTRFGIGGLKACLEMRGFCGGAVREPLRAAGEEAREEIRRCLAEADKVLREASEKQVELA